VSLQGGILPYTDFNGGLPSSTVALGSVGIGDFLSQGEVKPIYQVKDNAGKIFL
jgi:hypothetical protein